MATCTCSLNPIIELSVCVLSNVVLSMTNYSECFEAKGFLPNGPHASHQLAGWEGTSIIITDPLHAFDLTIVKAKKLVNKFSGSLKKRGNDCLLCLIASYTTVSHKDISCRTKVLCEVRKIQLTEHHLVCALMKLVAHCQGMQKQKEK